MPTPTPSEILTLITNNVKNKTAVRSITRGNVAKILEDTVNYAADIVSTDDTTNRESTSKAISVKRALDADLPVLASDYFSIEGASVGSAHRVDDVISNVIDDYTGELLTFYKITGATDEDVDGVIIVKKDTEYFRRSFTGAADVTWFGAVADGTTDNLTPISNAFAALQFIGGGTLFFPDGEYRITDEITDSANTPIHIIMSAGATLIADFDGVGRKTALSISGLGTQSNSTTLNTISVKGGFSLILNSVTGFAVGDNIIIKDTTALWPYDEGEGFYPGELNQIDSINVGTNTIYLKSPVSWVYNPTITTVAKISLRNNVVLENIKISTVGEVAAKLNTIGIAVSYANNTTIHGAIINGTGTAGVAVSNSINAVVNDNIINDVAFTGATTSYGVSIGAGRNVVISGNVITNARGCVDISGALSIPSWDILIENNLCSNPTNSYNQRGIGTHGPAGNVSIIGNKIIGSLYGLLLRGCEIKVISNIIKYSTNGGILAATGTNYTIKNNVFENTGTNAIKFDLLEMVSGDFIKINGNEGSGFTNGVRFQYGTGLTYYNVEIANNNLNATTTDLSLLDGGTLNHLTYVNNSSTASQWLANSGTITAMFAHLVKPITTAERPPNPEDGSCCFDTDINKPIWYDATSASWKTPVTEIGDGIRVTRVGYDNLQYTEMSTGGTAASIFRGVSQNGNNKPMYIDAVVTGGTPSSSNKMAFRNGVLGAEVTRMAIDKDGRAVIGAETPNASAALDITSNAGGLLLPRMTGAQGSSIASPADGLIIYITATDATFTELGFWGRVNSTWVKMHL